MSVLFTYICTHSTVDPYIPRGAVSLPILARDVSDGFQALSGGRNVVGQLAQFPVQRSVPNHLLCDGREVRKADFPELFELLGNTQGNPAAIANFVLPNFINAPLASATTQSGEVVQASSTVATPAPAYAPLAVTDLTASAQSATTVHLHFTALHNATSHEYRVNGGAAVALAADRIVTGLVASTAYTFEVRGLNAQGAAPWSNTASATTQAAADPAPPPPPPDPEPVPAPVEPTAYPIYGDVDSGGRPRRFSTEETNLP